MSLASFIVYVLLKEKTEYQKATKEWCKCYVLDVYSTAHSSVNHHTISSLICLIEFSEKSTEVAVLTKYVPDHRLLVAKLNLIFNFKDGVRIRLKSIFVRHYQKRMMPQTRL